MKPARRWRGAGLAGVLVAVATLALGSPAGSADPAVRAGPLVISQAWSRATPPGAAVGAGYLEIRNTGDTVDRLVQVSTPVAASVQVHETRLVDGTLQMRPVEDLLVPAGGTVRLEPGGMHLMLIDLVRPLTAGVPVPLVLEFARAGRVSIALAVAPPGAPGPLP